MKFGLAIVLWLIAAIVAVANGYLGNTVVATLLGDYGVHVYKSVVIIAVVFLLARLYAGRTRGVGWATAASGAGLLWLVLTITFEFIFGHYLFGNPWERLLADYRIWQGRLWPLVLLSDLLAPLLVGWRLNR
jgi:hypothetical protein